MAHACDPARRHLPLAHWPEADRLAWSAATFRGDMLDVQGRLAVQAPRTLENYRSAYGRWLTFLERRGALDTTLQPAARATPSLMVEFVEELRTQVAPLTVAQRVIDLEQVLRAFAPDADWTWICKLARWLTRTARPQRDKRAAIRSTMELCSVGRRLMARAESLNGGQLKRRAEMYRDGLMLALLAMRPFRLTNYTSIRVGVHLRRVGTGWAILFAEEEIKTRAPLELPFPEELVGALERYLEFWRRALLGKGTSDRLWISATGRPYGIQGVRGRIKRATENELGSKLWPHLFRDCLATHMALEDPGHVRIASVMLGHRHMGTTERYYILAGQRQAAQRWHAALLTRRRKAEQRDRSG